ncbi:MAG: hypothetical protein V1820_04355 [archaeon]
MFNRKLQIGIVGDSEDPLLLESAGVACARRGAVILVENSPFGELVVTGAARIATMRHLSFSYPKSGGHLEFRANSTSKISAIEALCNSSDGLVILGDAPLVEEIARSIKLPISKPGTPDACLPEISDLINRIVAESIRQ